MEGSALTQKLSYAQLFASLLSLVTIIFNVHGQLFLTLNLCCGENRSDTNADATY